MIQHMAASIAALVEPTIMRWARESAGLTPLAAARKLKVPDNRVGEWESGARLPTVTELKRATKVYRRSLGVFFLSQPPAGFETLRDFRRRPGVRAASWSVDLHAEYRRAHDQRDILLEIYELEEGTPPTEWRLAIPPTNDDALADEARQRLLSNSPIPIPTGADKYQHLNFWTTALEAAGVVVFASAGGRVDPAEMAAFSLFEDVLPVIVVNGADFPRGRLFSLMHEYAHLLLRSGGICDALPVTRSTEPNQRLEARCNDLAARILMPRDAVLARPQVIARVGLPTDWDYEALRDAAAPFGVSAEAFLLRLVSLGRSTQSYYDEMRPGFAAAYRRQENSSATTGKGNWYFNKARDLGKGYVRQVTGARSRFVIDNTTAARFLGVKVTQLDRLANAAGARSPLA
jgi:Zn-dependent peptidase ImmA (M78 family)